MRVRRRHLLVTGGTVIGAGLLGYGGSLAACRTDRTVASLLQPLFVALADIPAPEAIGRGWLSEIGASGLEQQALQRTDLLALTVLPDPSQRRTELAGLIREDFQREATVVVENWVVTEAEALIAGAWMS